MSLSHPGPASDLTNRFTSHPPAEGQHAMYDEIRRLGFELAAVIEHLVRDSAERRNAIDHVDAAVMWANAGLARHTDCLGTSCMRCL